MWVARGTGIGKGLHCGWWIIACIMIMIMIHGGGGWVDVDGWIGGGMQHACISSPLLCPGCCLLCSCRRQSGHAPLARSSSSKSTRLALCVILTPRRLARRTHTRARNLCSVATRQPACDPGNGLGAAAAALLIGGSCSTSSSRQLRLDRFMLLALFPAHTLLRFHRFSPTPLHYHYHHHHCNLQRSSFSSTSSLFCCSRCFVFVLDGEGCSCCR
ncbi:hypothetical protein EDC01DRAFT_268541 [Geopyxis carbonaria]|nr:hypothetical protein EDC01DRAFT_268541 [Geopyxis carbonaria]